MNINARESQKNVRGRNANASGQNVRNRIMRNGNTMVSNNENEIYSIHSIQNNRGEEAIMRFQEQVVEQQEIINNLLNQWGEPLREEYVLVQARPE